MADSSRLGKAIADALIGGTLGGLSAEAGKDFLTPFLQAQREDFDKQDKLEATAISNFSKSMNATGQAIQGNSREAWETGAYKNRIDETTALALSQARTPGAQQLILSTREATLATGKQIYEADLQSQFTTNAREKGDFTWLTQSAVPGREKSRVAAVAAVTAPETTIGQNWTEAQKLELLLESGTDSGVKQSELFDIPGTDQIQEIISGVREAKGGLTQYVNENPKKGATLLTRLSAIDPGEFTRITENLEAGRRLSGVADSLRLANRNLDREVPNALVSSDSYAVDKEGNVTFRPEKFGEIMTGLYKITTDPSDLAHHINYWGRAVGASNTEEFLRAAVRGADITAPSSGVLAEDIGSELVMVQNLFTEGIPDFEALKSSEGVPFTQLVHNRNETEAKKVLEANNINPAFYHVVIKGGSYFRGRLVDDAVSGNTVVGSALERVEDDLLRAEASGANPTEIARLVENQKRLTVYRDSRFPTVVNDTLNHVLEVVASRDPEEYETAVLGYLATLKDDDMFGMSEQELGEPFKKRLAEIAGIDNMFDRLAALGKFVGNVALGSESNISPELSKSRDQAKIYYTESLGRLLNALPEAISMLPEPKKVGWRKMRDKMGGVSTKKISKANLALLLLNTKSLKGISELESASGMRWLDKDTSNNPFSRGGQVVADLLFPAQDKDTEEPATDSVVTDSLADTEEPEVATEEAAADTKAPVTELSAEERKAEKARVEESLRNVHSEAIKKRVAEKSSAKAAELKTLQESWEKKKKPTLLTPSKFSGFPGNYPLVGESNVLLGTVEFGGVHVVAPTMRDGKQMEEHEILEMIFTESGGFGNTRIGFPKFKTEKAAQAWIKKNHGKISEDGRYTGRSK